MCGIAGSIGRPDASLVREMVQRLTHRGPDDQHAVHIRHASLACARLSLLDLPRGRQPVGSADGRIFVAFNGEIYNHAALRADLRERHGCVFTSRSDTEVILHGFLREGTAFLSRLEGMYAVAITDGETLWLARDSFGMKPLFWWQAPDRTRLLFASEVKALLAERAVPRKLDRTALVEFATFGFVLGTRTLFESVAQVSPGELLTIMRQPDGTLHLTRRTMPVPSVPEFSGTRDQAADAVSDLLRDSVTEQLVADHPVGFFLSGGVDSTLIAAMTTHARSGLAFTAGDREDPGTTALAARVTAHLQATSELIHLDADAYSAAIPLAVAAMELPMMPTLAFMCAPHVRLATKAVLCGDGADELFAGYAAHADPDRLLNLYRTRLAAITRLSDLDGANAESAEAALGSLEHPSLRERQQRLYDFLRGDQLTNYHLWLWDRGSMASGLEVRLPFLNRRLRALVDSLPPHWREGNGVTKPILRHLVRRVLPPPLAEAIVNQPKQAAWFAGRRCLRTVQAHAARALGEIAPHPLRSLFRFPVERLLLDLFVIIFLVRDGIVPPGVGFAELRKQHAGELASAYRA